MVEVGLSQLRRRALNRAVVRALREGGRPDLERLVHHAVRAEDAATIIDCAPRAAREAAVAGSHRQALAHFEAALPHVGRLPPIEQGRLLDGYAWELYLAQRFTEAMAAGRDAVARFERLGDPVAIGEALVRLSRHVFMCGDTDEAERLIERAVEVLRTAGSTSALATAATDQGGLLTLTGRPEDAVTVLRLARRLAVAAGRPDLESLCLNYLGLTRSDLGEPDGEADLREGLPMALAHGCHEAAARTYTNLGQLLYAYGKWAELAECVTAGLAFSAEHGLRQHTSFLELQRQQLRLRQGDWDTAEQGLREIIGRSDESSVFDVYILSTYGRLLARRGRIEAGDLLEPIWQRAVHQRSPLALAHAGTASVEWAWLAGRPDRAREVAEVLLPRMWSTGWAYLRGELLRFLARAGVAAESFEGCPEGYAAGLRGDWRAATAAWESVGDPYERALELADSGEVEPTLEALRVLDELGAAAPAALVRLRLRAGSGPAPARSAPHYPGQPRRADRPAARRAGTAGRGRDELRDRRAAGAVGAHGRPPRLRHTRQARGPIAPPGHRHRPVPRPLAPGQRRVARPAVIPAAADPAKRDRLGIPTSAGYALGSLVTGAFSTVPGLLLLPYFTDTLGVAAGLAGVLVFAPKAWNIALNPVAGRASDRTGSRIGPRRPYVLVAGLGVAIAFAAMFAGPAVGAAGAAWAAVGYLITASVFAFFQAPYAAMPAEITSGYAEHTRLMSWRVAGIAVAVLVSGALAPTVVEAAGGGVPGHRAMGVAIGALIAVGALGAFVGTRRAPLCVASTSEPSLHRQLAVARGNRPFQAVAGDRHRPERRHGSAACRGDVLRRHVLDEPDATAGLFAAFTLPAVLLLPVLAGSGARANKRAGVQASSAIFIAASLALLGGPAAGLVAVLALTALLGCANAVQDTFVLAMLPDCIADATAHTRRRQAGVFAGLFSGGQGLGFALGPLLFGLVLQLAGYLPSATGVAAEQSSGTATGVHVGFAVLPALLTAVSLVAVRRYPQRPAAARPQS